MCLLQLASRKCLTYLLVYSHAMPPAWNTLPSVPPHSHSHLAKAYPILQLVIPHPVLTPRWIRCLLGASFHIILVPGSKEPDPRNCECLEQTPTCSSLSSIRSALLCVCQMSEMDRWRERERGTEERRTRFHKGLQKQTKPSPWNLS